MKEGDLNQTAKCLIFLVPHLESLEEKAPNSEQTTSVATGQLPGKQPASRVYHSLFLAEFQMECLSLNPANLCIPRIHRQDIDQHTSRMGERM